MRGGQSVKVVRLTVRYDCWQVCQVSDENPDGDMASRAACRCSLPGFDSSKWDPSADPRAAADAERLASDVAGHAYQAGISLDFDLDRDGCPRGWADSHFGATVMRYAGARSLDSPVRTQNVRLLGRVLRDEEPPTRLLDMVAYGEAAEDSCLAWFREVVNRQ